MKKTLLLTLMLALTGCAGALLPPVTGGWLVAGPESQVVLERRLDLEFIDQGDALRADYRETRLVRQPTTVTLRVPTGPEQRIEAIAVDWRTLNGPINRLTIDDFAPIDRTDKPLAAGKSPAFYAHRLKLPAGSLLRWRWLAHHQRPSFPPVLDLSGPFPVNKAELRIAGSGAALIDLKTSALPGGIVSSESMVVGTWKNLQPATAHPYAPGRLGRRMAYAVWKQPKHPGLVERLVQNKQADYQLRALPGVIAKERAIPCLLRYLGADDLRPNEVVMSTASQRAEGGYDLHLPGAYRRPFKDCTLIQPGATARIPVVHESGTRLLRIRTSVDADGAIEGRGQLIFSGVGARLVRQGSIDMKQVLAGLVAPMSARVGIGTPQVSGTGPVHLPFKISFRANQLDPTSWLGTPLPELGYLGSRNVFGPSVEQRRVEWVFDWPSGVRPPPPTRMASASSGPLQASLTWSLGPQRTLRFVRSTEWQKRSAQIEPELLRSRLHNLRIPALPLPTN